MRESQKETIERLRQELEDAYKRISELTEAANNAYHETNEYKATQQELKNLRTIVNRDIMHIESQVKTDERMRAYIEKVLADNRALCKRHGVKYWEGIAQQDRYAYRDIREMEQEITDLKALVKAKDIVIDHYKNLLSGKETERPEKRKRGRPKTDDEQVKRIRKLRRDGWTLRQIQEAEGISLGMVSKICREVKQKKEKNE